MHNYLKKQTKTVLVYSIRRERNVIFKKSLNRIGKLKKKKKKKKGRKRKSVTTRGKRRRSRKSDLKAASRAAGRTGVFTQAHSRDTSPVHIQPPPLRPLRHHGFAVRAGIQQRARGDRAEAGGARARGDAATDASVPLCLHLLQIRPSGAHPIAP